MLHAVYKIRFLPQGPDVFHKIQKALSTTYVLKGPVQEQRLCKAANRLSLFMICVFGVVKHAHVGVCHVMLIVCLCRWERSRIVCVFSVVKHAQVGVCPVIMQRAILCLVQ